MTRDEAKVRVAEYLAKLEVGRPFKLVVLDQRTREEDFGWVFFYNTQKFVETGDVQWALGGNSPLIVDRHTGDLHVTGTAHPIEHYIEKFRRQRASSS